MLLYLLAAMMTLTPQGQKPPAPCADPHYRDFDFWVGDWEVADAKGTRQGHNRVERIEGGCAIQENWTGAGGMTGRSLNTYRPSAGTWHQTWVSSQGALLLLDGRFDGRSMILGGPSPNPEGGTLHNRITWTPLPDGRVRQLWEQSPDGKSAWRVVFDGYYARTAKATR
jgi:hypothetical protein